MKLKHHKFNERRKDDRRINNGISVNLKLKTKVESLLRERERRRTADRKLNISLIISLFQSGQDRSVREFEMKMQRVRVAFLGGLYSPLMTDSPYKYSERDVK